MSDYFSFASLITAFFTEYVGGATFFGWILISILYGLSVVFVVFRKLRSATSQMNKTLDSLPITSPAKRQFLEAVKQRTLVSAVVQRLIWYPIIPAMTQLTNCVLEIQIYVTQVVSFRLLLICYIAASIQGTLNAIVFSRDMAMIRGFESLRIYWWKTYVNPFEEQYPKFSHNKSAYFQKETHREPEHSKTDLIELDDFDNNTRVNSRDLGASGMNQFNAHLNNNNPMYPSIPDFGSVLQDISSFDRVSLNIDLEAQDDEITESFPSVWEKIRYFLLITIIRAPSDHEKSFLNHPVKSPSTSTYIIPSDDTIQVPSRNESILNIYTRNENEQQTGLNHTLKPERFEKTLITSAAASTKTSQTKSLDSTISEDSAQSPSSANLHMKKSSFLGRIPSFKSLTDKTSSFNSIMPISPVATSTIDQSKKHRSSHWNRNAHSSKFDISGMLLSNDFGINSIPQNIHTSPKSSVLADEEIDDMESDYSPSLRSFYRQLRAFSNDIELTLKQL
ncbi:hypothetical protein G9A89_012510 [Geosiphon pyriformis]|nr:hypothetical protein G9A89_012510 [Geosiphon pyriformis]